MAPTFITKLALSLSLFSYALTVTASPSASAAIQASHAKRHHDLAVKRNATESTPPHPARSHHTGRSPKDADAVQYDEYGRTIKKRGPALRFDYAGTKVRGVNLGGWLVLEVCQYIPHHSPSSPFELMNNFWNSHSLLPHCSN